MHIIHHYQSSCAALVASVIKRSLLILLVNHYITTAWWSLIPITTLPCLWFLNNLLLLFLFHLSMQIVVKVDTSHYCRVLFHHIYLNKETLGKTWQYVKVATSIKLETQYIKTTLLIIFIYCNYHMFRTLKFAKLLVILSQKCDCYSWTWYRYIQ
jgi:hypothetical protein